MKKERLVLWNLTSRPVLWATTLLLILAAITQPAVAGVPKCYGVNDTNTAQMFFMVPNLGVSPLPSSTTITMNRGFNSEGAAYRASNERMYLFQCASDNTGPCDLYEATIDLVAGTAMATMIADDIIPSGNRAVEGATFQVRPDGTDYLYASVGESSGQLYKWDPNNGWALEPGYPVNLGGDTTVVSGLAYDPRTDLFYGSKDYASTNGSSNNSDIYAIDVTTGVTTFSSEMSLNVDAEGLTYAADGLLYAEEDQGPSGQGRSIFAVDPGTGAMQQAATFGGSADAESLACNPGERSDLGDAPGGYGYAVHSIPVFDVTPSLLHLGTLPGDDDDDAVAQSGTGAGADDADATGPNYAGNDEDGVTRGGAALQDQSLALGASYTLSVATSGANSGYLNAWFDFNADGDFDDAGEQIATNAPGTPGGTISIPISIPAGSPAGVTYARFRYSTQQGLPSADDYFRGEEAPDGEVEDYRVMMARMSLDIDKTSDAVGPVLPGDTVSYTVLVTNSDTVDVTDVRLRDILPAGVTYVAASTSVTAPFETIRVVNETVRDEFNAVSYSNSDGTASWPGPWVEDDPYASGSGPGAGYVFISGGRLVFHYAYVNAEAITRSADLTGATSATLTFDYQTVGLDGGETLAIEASSSPTGPWTQLGTIGGSTTSSLTRDLTPYISATTTIRFIDTSSNWENGEYAYLDNIQIASSGTATTWPVETRTNGVGGTLDDGTPPDLVTANDGVRLQAGETMTVSYRVTRDSALCASLTNRASAAADGAITVEDSTTITCGEPTATISGSVFVDADGLTDGSVDGAGTDSASGNQLYVNLVDGGNVVAVAGVNPDGSYQLAGVPQSASYSAQLSTTAGTLGSPAPAQTLPAGWVNVGEDYGSGNGAGTGVDGAADGGIAIQVGTGDVSAVNLGIEQLPTANPVTTAGRTNPGGTARVPVPPLAGTDPEDGALGSGDSILIQTLPDPGSKGTLYYNGTAVSAGQTIANYDPALLTLDPVDGGVTVDFTYSVLDAAGEESPAAAVTMPFTAPRPGNLTGTVWLDVDGDGINDNGEPGIGPVGVSLVAQSTVTIGGVTYNPGDTVTAAETDAGGNYVFPGLPPGDYQVRVNPAELGSGGDLENLDEAPGNNSGVSAVLSLTGGETERADFGYVPTTGTAAIEGSVWSDGDANARQGAGEIGIGAVTVQLFNTDGSPALDGSNQPITAETAPDGSYALTGIPAGEYSVRVITGDAELIAFCSPVAVSTCATTALRSPPLRLLSGDLIGDIDFGFDAGSTYTVSDALWNDIGGDGTHDPNGADGLAGTADDEIGIGGVSVDLIDCGNGTCSDGDESVVATAISDADGEVRFNGVPDGDYELAISDNEGVLGAMVETTGTGGSASVTISGGDDLSAPSDGGTPTFGYNQPNSIGGTIWSDADGDGANDEAETGLGGILVELQDGTCTSGLNCPTTTAAPDGSYLFTELAPGTYTLVVNPDGSGNGQVPPDFAGGSQTGDPDGALDSETTITLVGGESHPNLDFGYNRPALADVSGTVFNDLDTDGVHQPDGADGTANSGDEETGIASVTVTLSPVHDLIEGRLDLDGDGLVGAAEAAGDDNGVIDGSHDGVTVIDGRLDLNGNGAIDTADDGTFSGFVIVDGLFDSDGNGTAGEAGDQGVLVGDPVAAAETADGTTDANGDGNVDAGDLGYYLFPDVPDGDYQVAVTDDADTLDGYLLTSGLDQREVAVAVAQGDVTGVDFGYVQEAATASIGDSLWLDADGDGIRGASEAGISGVTLELFDTGPDGQIGGGDDVSIGTATTGVNGTYLFDALPAGNYFVDVVGGVPSGLQPTTGSSDPTGVVTLSDGEAYLDADIGYGPVAGRVTLGNSVWYDTNANGVQDAGETGIGGVDLIVIDETTGNTVATVTTAADGSWLAAGLDPGTGTRYAVFVDRDTLPAGVVPTPTNLGGGDTYVTATLTGGEVRTNLDFGYSGGVGGSIGDSVWLDSDGDGSRDSGEAGLSGVTVRLFDAADLGPDGVAHSGDEAPINTLVTDTNGQYRFTGLLAGDFYVTVQGGTVGALGGTNASAVNGYSGDIALSAGQVYEDADFGYEPGSGTAVIGDALWSDADGDGTRDAGEVGIGGATVRLCSDAACSGLIRTTTTAADGSYLFTGVPATGTEDYFVVVTPPAGYDAAPTNNGGSPSYALTNLTGGQIVDTADWGFDDSGTDPVNGGAIGDLLYRSDLGSGIAGVTLDLYGVGDDGQIGTADDPLVASTTTDAGGNYGFSGVPQGEYRVAVTDVGGALAALALTDAPAAGATITCNPGCNSALNQDFGYATAVTGTGSIGDLVWFDADGDGVRDGTESGISGVTLNLIGAGPDGTFGTADDVVLATQTTDSGGAYDFTGLGAGDYRVVVSDNNQVLSGLLPSNGPAMPVTITCTTATSCTDHNDSDFGYEPTVGGGLGTLGGTLWRDTDQTAATGVLDAGEPGLQGVTLDLWLDDGDGVIEPGIDNLVRTTSTNANGDYQFLGLPPGAYIVDVTDTSRVTAGMASVQGPAPTQDGNGHQAPYAVTLPIGATDTSVDFAYQAAATPYSISGTLFEDSGAAGTLGLNDGPGIDPTARGGTVSLYRTVNGQEYFVGVTTTDGDGAYSFSDLPAGDYLVEVDIAGTLVEGMQQSADPDQYGTQCTACDSAYAVTLSPTTANPDGTPASGNLTGVDFGYWNGGLVTTPVTLAFFKAKAGRDDRVRFEWWTATETRNVGFDLYVEVGDEWIAVNPDPIASRVITSEVPQRYRYRANVPEGRVFWLVDIDTEGKEIAHGPYRLGEAHGHKPRIKRTDWKKVRQEHRLKKRLRGKRKLRAAAAQARNATVQAQSTGAVNLIVTGGGIHRVSYESLYAAGVDLKGVKPRHLELTNRDRRVPIRVENVRGRKRFGPGSYIEFVGEGLTSLYTEANPYRLSVSNRPTQRVKTDSDSLPEYFISEPYYMETLTIEDQREYDPATPTDDPWYDDSLLAWRAAHTGYYGFEVDGYLAGAAPVTLQVGLWGVTDLPADLDHHVLVELNGELLAEERFDGAIERTISTEVSVGVLAEGSNSLSLHLPLDMGDDVEFDMINLDRYAVTYPRRFLARDGRLSFTAAGKAFTVHGLPSADVLVYRVAPSGAVARLTAVQTSATAEGFSASFLGTGRAATYHVASVEALAAPAIEAAEEPVDCSEGGAADYLVVAHDQFITADLDRLVAQREGEGYRVDLVAVSGLYARYSHGIVDPEAIRACVAEAARLRGTRAVLLVGGASYDPKDYLGLGAVDFVPTFYAKTDAFVNFAPTDSLIADTDGDGVQDLAIGRFPVRTEQELTNIVDQTLAYGLKDYGRTAVFAADRYDSAQAYDFRADSKALVEFLPADWQVESAYIGESGLQGAHDTLVGAINAGVALTAYVGHSYDAGWSFEGLFTTDDVPGLTNAGRPTVVTQLGCWNTYFVSPHTDTLGHRFLLSGNRGAAAVMGASTLTEAANETDIARRLFGESGLMDGYTTVGEALLRAKRAVAAEYPGRLDVIQGWQLLGDPLLRLDP